MYVSEYVLLPVESPMGVNEYMRKKQPRSSLESLLEGLACADQVGLAGQGFVNEMDLKWRLGGKEVGGWGRVFSVRDWLRQRCSCGVSE